MLVSLVVADALFHAARPVRRRGGRVRAAEDDASPDVAEEARIRAELEAYAARTQGQHRKKRLSPSAARRRAKRGASFEEGQELGAALAAELRRCRKDGRRPDDAAIALLEDLVSTTSGARGWFVALLTDPDLGPLFEPPVDDALLLPIAERPEPNLRLVVMNVVSLAARKFFRGAAAPPRRADASRRRRRGDARGRAATRACVVPWSRPRTSARRV